MLTAADSSYLPFLDFFLIFNYLAANGRRDDDMARSQELDDRGLLTLEVIRSTTRNALKRKIEIS